MVINYIHYFDILFGEVTTVQGSFSLIGKVMNLTPIISLRNIYIYIYIYIIHLRRVIEWLKLNKNIMEVKTHGVGGDNMQCIVRWRHFGWRNNFRKRKRIGEFEFKQLSFENRRREYEIRTADVRRRVCVDGGSCKRDSLVAERTSYFCLARKSIWPLWSSHIFTQWGWLILFSPDHFPGQHKNGESLPNYLFLRTFREGRTYFLSAPFIAAVAQHHEETFLINGTLESTLLDQGFTVEQELDARNPSHRDTFMPPLTFAMSTATRNHAQTSSYHIPGQPLWRLSCLSPTVTRTTHLWTTTSFLSFTSKHDFCYIYGDAYFAQTFNNALTVATHISLRHLAAAIPSQLNRYFLPSYETCSIKVPFILAAIKPS